MAAYAYVTGVAATGGYPASLSLNIDSNPTITGLESASAVATLGEPHISPDSLYIPTEYENELGDMIDLPPMELALTLGEIGVYGSLSVTGVAITSAISTVNARCDATTPTLSGRLATTYITDEVYAYSNSNGNITGLAITSGAGSLSPPAVASVVGVRTVFSLHSFASSGVVTAGLDCEVNVSDAKVNAIKAYVDDGALVTGDTSAPTVIRAYDTFDSDEAYPPWQ